MGTQRRKAAGVPGEVAHRFTTVQRAGKRLPPFPSVTRAIGKRVATASLGTAMVGLLGLSSGTGGVLGNVASHQIGPKTAMSSVAVVNAKRAAETYHAFQKYLYIPRYSLYQSSNTSSLFSYLWPFTNAMAATDYISSIPGKGAGFKKALKERYSGLFHYYNKAETTPTGLPQPPAFASAVEPPLGDGGSTFYDDNAWVSLDLLMEYNITHDKKYLSRAEAEFRYVVTGWDTNPYDACPGGVFWVDASWNRDRNTVSNAPNAEVGLQLYEDTHNAFYLDWAYRMYSWVNRCLRAPNGMYYDHINPEGKPTSSSTALWSYNQGTMIGAGVLLYEITGDKSYLVNAKTTATASLQYYGTDNRLYQQPAKFNAIFFRNLLLLNEVSPNNSYLQMIETYADSVWKDYRTATGLFIFPGSGTSLVNQTAPMIEIFSLLAGAPPLAVSGQPKIGRRGVVKIGPLPPVRVEGHPTGPTQVTGVAPAHPHS